MNMATRTDTRSPPLHVADTHDLFRVHGAPENNRQGRQHRDPEALESYVGT